VGLLQNAVRRTLLGIIAAACFPISAIAQNFPEQPIKILVPFPPGGGTDFVSRIVGAKLAEMTGWQVVIENRPGAGGNLAIEVAARAPQTAIRSSWVRLTI